VKFGFLDQNSGSKFTRWARNRVPDTRNRVRTSETGFRLRANSEKIKKTTLILTGNPLECCKYQSGRQNHGFGVRTTRNHGFGGSITGFRAFPVPKLGLSGLAWDFEGPEPLFLHGRRVPMAYTAGFRFLQTRGICHRDTSEMQKTRGKPGLNPCFCVETMVLGTQNRSKPWFLRKNPYSTLVSCTSDVGG